MSVLGTLSGTGSIPHGNSLVAVQYVIQVTKDPDGLVSGKGTLSGPPQELFDFVASDGSDLRLETGDRIQIDIRTVRGRDADFVVIGDIPGFN